MTVHRLNRFEYRNAVRDLLGLDVDIEALLPPDDADAEGFDNNAEVLSVSTTLMERYLTAARRISQLAVGDPAVAPRAQSYSVPQLEVQDVRTSEDLPFGSRGGLAVEHYFPLDGEYRFKVDLHRNFYNYIRGLGNEPHQLDVRIDKALVQTFMVGGAFEGARCPTSYCGLGSGGFPEWGTYSVIADEELHFTMPVEAGMRRVGAAFLRRPALDEGVRQPRPSPATFGFSTDDRQDGEPRAGPADDHRTVRRQQAGGNAEPAENLRLSARERRTRGRVRGRDPERAGPARVPAPGDAPRRDGADELLRGGLARRRVRGGRPGRAGVPADRSRVRVPRGARASRRRAGVRLSDQ